MDYLIVCLIALLAGGLTLITGFGLGTLLMPAFAIFFPPEVAIGATAVVHLANSLFKLAAIGRWAKWPIVWAFGLPAILAAVAGALLLSAAARLPAFANYQVGPIEAAITPVGILVGLLIVAFAVFETVETLSRRPGPVPTESPAPAPTPSRRRLAIGGLNSGFFGGLSGHQGALRTIFLVRAGLTPKEFAGTGSTISALVDITRLAVYAAGATLFTKDFGAAGHAPWTLIAAACLAAFVGSALGAQVIKKVTMTTVRRAVAAMMAILGSLIAAGIL